MCAGFHINVYAYGIFRNSVLFLNRSMGIPVGTPEERSPLKNRSYPCFSRFAPDIEVKTFNDGSTVVLKFSVNQKPIDGGKKTAMEGTWEVAGGTGRYAGAKGSGTYKSVRIGDFKTGGDTYADFTGTLTMK